MKREITLNLSWVLLTGLVFIVSSASGQTIAYRQVDLASNIPNIANSEIPDLTNPWGITFLAGQPFFIANNRSGVVKAFDATGFPVLTPFTAPNPDGTGPDHPTGIVAVQDPNSTLGNRLFPHNPFFIVTDEGRIFETGPDGQGNFPPQATLAFDSASNGAVYKGVAIVNPTDTGSFVTVTNFNSGLIETFGAPPTQVALGAGTFKDPNLPAGYAPFGIQAIGNQVFVTYAVQDAAKHAPVMGAGNGIVNIFDLDGNFVRRFATGGPLNVPWGVTQASANFGPFSNDILIGNVGDGTISAFDPAGNFLGQISDGGGNVISDLNLHAMAFRNDGFGDPNKLYFTAGIGGGLFGVFGEIGTGLVSITRVSAPATQANASVRITATVAAAPGNSGTPTGSVAFLDGSNPLGTTILANGTATFDAVLTGVRVHTIAASYAGDVVFLASTANSELQVAGVPTKLNLTAPANAAPGATVQLVAKINAQAGGTPTGQIAFQDGNTSLGSVNLDTTGMVTLSISTLAPGQHTLTASYGGDTTFASSTSAAVTINIANADFSLGASPMTAAVTAGQSAQFMLTVTPAGGFANNVSFSCSPATGITCAFNPATVTPTNGAASTTLTVTTSATVSRYGLLLPSLLGPGSLFAALMLFALLLWRGRNLQSIRPALITATAVLAIAGISLTVVGCGGYGSAGTQPNRGSASIMVTAQSGTISHATTLTVTVQ